MTMTVKLDAPLEQALRIRSAALGRSASALIREALQTYLAQTEPVPTSAYELGKHLFGRYAGSPDMSSQRKAVMRDIWDEKWADRDAASTLAAPAPTSDTAPIPPAGGQHG